MRPRLIPNFETEAEGITTDHISPRRGRILRRDLSQCQPSVLRQFFPANHPPTATGNSTSESSQRVRSLFPLPGGEGQGESERRTKLGLQFVRGMIVRGMKSQPEELRFPIPLTTIPLTKIPFPSPHLH
jgi:hypothetical protein